MSKLIGVLLVLISATAFGIMPFLAQIAYHSGVGLISLLFLRFLIAAGVLWTIALWRKQPLPNASQRLRLVLVGGVGFVAQSLSFYGALLLLNPGLAVLLLYLYPSFVCLIESIARRQRLQKRQWLALALSFCGLVLVVGAQWENELLGLTLGVGSAIVYALYVILGGTILRESSLIGGGAIAFGSTAAMFGGLVLIEGIRLPQNLSGWLAVVAIALVCTVVAIGALFAGIDRLGTSMASVLSSWEVVVTIAIAASLFGDAIKVVQLVGGGLILWAVLLLAKSGGGDE